MRTATDDGLRNERYLRLREVLAKTGVGKSYAYEDPEFPKPYRLGRRMVAWRESEVLAWMQSRPRARDDFTEAS